MGGVEIERATSRSLPTASSTRRTHVIQMAQPFSRFAKTLLEIQHYPDLRLYPGGPPKPPYDITAHSLPLQMGVEAVQVTSPSRPPDARRAGRAATGPSLGNGRAGDVWLLDPRVNASARAVNLLLSAGGRAYRLDAGGDEPGNVRGAFLVEGVSAEVVDRIARETHVTIEPRPIDGLAGSAAPVARAAHWALSLLAAERHRRGLDPLRARTLRLLVHHHPQSRHPTGRSGRTIRRDRPATSAGTRHPATAIRPATTRRNTQAASATWARPTCAGSSMPAAPSSLSMPPANSQSSICTCR